MVCLYWYSLYSYVTICQSDVDEEGEVKLMSLKVTNNNAFLFKADEEDEVKLMSLKVTNNNAFLFKADEEDISYVSFDDILEILPNPSLIIKGNRVYYKFPKRNPNNFFLVQSVKTGRCINFEYIVRLKVTSSSKLDQLALNFKQQLIEDN
ncbi:unnamed protein product [Parnassius mnemosyne]|uniref:Uncharacterized protein n=1 Tax=Parnassius mnemosyne TaxID=213953 RepID=A0AAV1M6A5_9NEOP